MVFGVFQFRSHVPSQILLLYLYRDCLKDYFLNLFSLFQFNFVGKLLGPKGNSLKRIQEETLTKMAVLGRGSMRDKQKEEDLRLSADAKYQHLHEDLHVEVTAFAPPAEAHARLVDFLLLRHINPISVGGGGHRM